jgi:hypothetical protein
LGNIMDMLIRERKGLRFRLNALDRAIMILGGKPKRKVSAATRAKMQAAAKARWAKNKS